MRTYENKDNNIKVELKDYKALRTQRMKSESELKGCSRRNRCKQQTYFSWTPN